MIHMSSTVLQRLTTDNTPPLSSCVGGRGGGKKEIKVLKFMLLASPNYHSTLA
jgi:hypothetical protein